ncbi:MAG: hypothetical protein HOH43_00800 [Candidatus Latescibacteria bacterium]|nr:hypothetical protein [Candidatus Latescibacterota bacterium]
MIPLDYGRSFLIGTAAFNEVRFWVESRMMLLDDATGDSEQYIQAASCKSEDTFAQENLFLEDNYDFLPVFGPKIGIIFRRKVGFDPNYKQCLPITDMWGGPRYDLTESTNCEVLSDNHAIIAATHDGQPLVAQTEIRDTESKRRAIIEYPLKTMNTRREDGAYQVDTGPVLFPDFVIDHVHSSEMISLAFVAFNGSTRADFILEAPTDIHRDRIRKATVHHYSRRIALPSINRIYAVR